ncbi:MAG: hypothetical protein KJ000_20020 [Pirellulaceae bacterium]|nr:hypothetical protein [Pirellulaceae bacterium]
MLALTGRLPEAGHRRQRELVNGEARMRALLLVLLATTACSSARAEVLPTAKAEEAANDELAKVQGKWVRTVKTDRGTFKVVKEHKGNDTTVTFFDSDGNVMAEKTSQFRLEQTGKVRIFTFFNNVITAGPQKGQIDKAPTSFVYRVTGDTFFEVNGLLIGDDTEPLAFSWKRVNE